MPTTNRNTPKNSNSTPRNGNSTATADRNSREAAMNDADLTESELRDNPLAPYTQSEAEKKLAERITKRYQAGIAYKSNQGLYEKWGEYDRFWNGDQWPEPTAETEDMPRPVTNHFAKIHEQKVAAITYEQPEIFFEPVEGAVINDGEPAEEPEEADNDASTILSNVAKFEYRRLDMEELNDIACRNASVLCNGIYFFPWDNTLRGGGRNSAWRGNVAGEIIDPADFYPDDPTNRDIQSQPGIIMTERVPYSKLRYMKEYNQDIVATIRPSENDESTDRPYDQQATEIEETGYVDLIHRWWKEPVDDEGDEDEPEEAARNAAGEEMQDTEPINPLPQEEALPDAAAMGLDPTLEPIDLTEEEILLATEEPAPKKKKPTVNLHYAVVCDGKLLRHTEFLYHHGKYPFASFQWYPKRYSFFGKPESDDLIANQKEENRLAGISLLAAYTSGLPDLEYNEKWIKRRDIEGGAGGRLIANSNPSGQTGGVTIHQATPPSGHIAPLRESMTAGMNDVSGVTEAFSGNAPGGDLNASAIIALQEAAGVRMRGIQRRFNRALREVGQIWLAHWKEFYQEARLIRIVGDDNKAGFMWFTGTDYADMEFDVNIESGSASPFNKSLYLSLLDKMFEGGIIGPDEYLEFLPADVFPRVQQVMERRKQKEMEAQAMQLTTKIALMKQAISQVLSEAQAAGVPITPEAVQMLSQLVQQIAVEEAQMQGEATAGAAAGGAGSMQGAGGAQGGMPGLPGLPDMSKPQVQGGLI